MTNFTKITIIGEETTEEYHKGIVFPKKVDGESLEEWEARITYHETEESFISAIKEL